MSILMIVVVRYFNTITIFLTLETKSGQGINGHLGDVWGTMKATSPLGNVPILTMEDGSEYSQSVAIARYFANKAGIAGQTEDEKLHADMIGTRYGWNLISQHLFTPLTL